MIFDRLNNAKQYFSLNKKFKKAFEFLLNNDLNSLQDGKYIIEPAKISQNNNKNDNCDEIYANVQTLTTKNKSLKNWEVHKKYIDIQYVIHGQECMEYGILEDFKDTVEKYDDEKDVEFLTSTNYFNSINVKAGNFVIFYPNDVHAPMLSVWEDKEIKKVIVKIKI